MTPYQTAWLLTLLATMGLGLAAFDRSPVVLTLNLAVVAMGASDVIRARRRKRRHHRHHN